MTYLTHDICLRLRDAGLPQPELAIGQFWYLTRYPGGTLENHALSVVIQHYSNPKSITFMPLDAGDNPNQHLKIFCPDAEYLLANLPPGYVIQKHKGHHQFGDQYAVFNLSSPLIADAAPTAARAAADVYLTIHEKTPAP